MRSLYAGRGGRRPREEEDSTELVLPVPPGAVATAHAHVAEPVDIDNSAGLPVTTPFTN
jgi:hypothetical protein